MSAEERLVELCGSDLPGASYFIRVGRRWYPVPDEFPSLAAVRMDYVRRQAAADQDIPRGEQIAAEIITLVLGPSAMLRILATGPTRFRPLLLDTLGALHAVYKTTDSTIISGGEPA